MLLSTYVGAFACPGIDTQGHGTTVLVSSDTPSFYSQLLYVPWPGSNPRIDPSSALGCKSSVQTARQAGQART
jgi:hypothetical protein